MTIQPIDNWKQAYKMFSVWFFVILGLLPDLFNQAIAMGVIVSAEAPAILVRTINVVAFLGVAFRLVKQGVDQQLQQEALEEKAET